MDRQRLILFSFALGAFVSTAVAQLPTPKLVSVFPAGAKAGSSVELRANGTDLDEAAQMLFSHPGIKATAKMSAATEFEKAKPQPGVFEVQIPAELAAGIYEARVVGRFGISNPRAFVVGTVNEVVDAGGNNQPDKAIALPLDSIVNGVVDANQVDFLKVTLQAGQRVVLDCKARTIDSRMDAVLVVYNAAGKELARDRQANGDPLIDFTAPAEGEYRVAIYDFTYRGGNEFFYRLSASTGPHIDFIFPPSGVAGFNGLYTLYGRNLPGGQPADGQQVGNAKLQKLTVSHLLPLDEQMRRSLDPAEYVSSTSAMLDAVSYRLGNSNPVLIHYARAPVTIELEPNDKPAQAQLVPLPCEVVGQFYPARDVDYVTIQAKKGDVYDIEVISHQLGLPVDPFMLIQKVKKNDKGEESVQEVAQVDDPNDRNNRIGSEFDVSTDDPAYRLTADEDAVYRIMVRDQFGASRRDARMLYRLAIHRGEPDFRLVAMPNPVVAPANNNAVEMGGATVRKGATTLIQVRLERRYGFNGEVEVTMEGLPAGVTCPNLFLGPNANAGSFVVSAAEDAKAWAGSIRIIGKSKQGNSELVRYARGGTAVWGSANRQQELVPFRVTRDLAFAVTDRETLPAFAQAAEDKVFETSRGGKLEIPIRVARRGEFKEDLTLAANDLPNELKPQNLVIKAGEAEGKLQLAVTNGNAKPGLYTFYLRSDAKVKYQRNPDAVAAAEQEVKDVDAAVAMLTEKNKQAVEQKNSAVTAAQNAMNLAKQAEQEKVAAENTTKQAAEKAQQAVAAFDAAKLAATKDPALNEAAASVEKVKAEAEAAKTAADQKLAEAQKKLVDLQAAAKAAEEAKAVTEKAATEADAKLKAAQQAKTNTDKRLNDLKSANNPKELQFALISTPIRIRITESCLEVSLANATPSVKQAEKLELMVKINRLYGFDDPVDVTLDVPGEVKGIAANKVTIPKGQNEAKLEITAAKDAAAGTHQVSVRAKGRFNNIESETKQPVTLKVEPAA